MPEKVTKEEKIVELAINKAKEVIKEMRNEQQYIIDKDGELELNEKQMTDKEDLVKVKRPKKNPPEEKLDVIEGIADAREFKKGLPFKKPGKWLPKPKKPGKWLPQPITKPEDGPTDMHNPPPSNVATDEEWQEWLQKDGYYTAPEFQAEKFQLKTGKLPPPSANQ